MKEDIFKGENGYFLEARRENIFALKDEKNNELLTIFLKNNRISFVDVCEAWNSQTTNQQKVTELVMDFMQERNILPEVEKTTHLSICNNLNRLGLVISKDAVVCSLYRLPEGFETLKGVPFLCDLTMPVGAEIPDNVIVHGDLILNANRKLLMANNLKVEGKVFARDLERVGQNIPDEILVITNQDVEDFNNKPASVKAVYAGRYDNSSVKTRSKAQVRSLKEPEDIPLNLTLQKTRECL